MSRSQKPMIRVDMGGIVDLYNALLTIVRMNAQGHPTGHDAIVNARAVLAKVTGRAGRKVDWAKEQKL